MSCTQAALCTGHYLVAPVPLVQTPRVSTREETVETALGMQSTCRKRLVVERHHVWRDVKQMYGVRILATGRRPGSWLFRAKP